MVWTRFRLMAAAAAAFLIGVPLTPRAEAQSLDILFGSIDLAASIAAASDGS
jgi:hypothetical protein